PLRARGHAAQRRRAVRLGHRAGPGRAETGTRGIGWPGVTEGFDREPHRRAPLTNRMKRMREPTLLQKLGAEFLGPFWLVFAGAGTAVFAATFVAGNVVAGQSLHLGVGFLGVALAFGLSVMTMAYAVGHISGAHFNPAVTVGVAVAGRFEWKDVPAYIVVQVLGGLLGGTAIWGIARGQSGWDRIGNMAANGYGANSPG